MTKKETIQVLQSIEDRAVDFPYMTACDWVAIAAAKRHLENALEVKEVDLGEEYDKYYKQERHIQTFKLAKHFFELGLNSQRKISYVPNIDDSLKELGVDPDSKEAKIFKESYYTALEKLKAQKGK